MTMETYKNKYGQPIGWLKEGVFRKKVKESKHLFRLVDGWGIDRKVIDSLADNGCHTIRIKCTEKNLIYSISFTDFMDNAVQRQFGNADPQCFVSRKYFSTEQPS